MNEISASGSNLFGELGLVHKKEEENQENELGQRAFLKLMITQMENQDPLSPQDNTEFIAQLAQFSSVESLDRLNNNFDSFTNNFVANQALQASTLVGRSVTVPTDRAQLSLADVVSGGVEVPTSTSDVRIKIYSESGSFVDEFSLGQQPAGELVFRWDGSFLEVNGEVKDQSVNHPEGVTTGTYRFEVSSMIDGEETALETALSANVNSVTVGANGLLTLNLAGIGPVSLAEVKQFNE